MLLVVFVAIQRKKKKKKKTRTEMEPFNMSDFASHDKFHLVCVSRRMPNVCSITMKFSILSDWVCACVCVCVCAFYDNSFVLEKFIYLICTLSRLLPHPLYMCVCA